MEDGDMNEMKDAEEEFDINIVPSPVLQRVYENWRVQEWCIATNNLLNIRLQPGFAKNGGATSQFRVIITPSQSIYPI